MGPKRPQLKLARSSDALQPSSQESSYQTTSRRPTMAPKTVTFGRSSEPSEEIITEYAPLMPARQPGDEDSLFKGNNAPNGDDYFGEEEETKSTLFLFLLTLGGLGLQIGWSVETSNGSPFLLSLGLSKSMLALVWIAGPLSGALVQPYVGMKSDGCRITWGKRRPFIVGGAIATIASLMILAWSREIVGGVLNIFGLDKESQGVQTSVMVFAVLFVYVLDFAINVIQAGIRAYIVDVAPTHQQESANAWMIRSSGIGNILGYLAGNANLPEYFPWLGDSQFKVLCAIASFIMGVTVAISCLAVSERNPADEPPAEMQDGVLNFFRTLARSVRSLPVQIKRVCVVQFAAWIGWFPFLFYITTYIGEIYAEPFFEANPNLSEAELDAITEEGTRIGTRALLIFAVTTFFASVVLPFIIPPTYQAPKADPTTPMTPMTPGGRTPLTPRSLTGNMSSSGYFSLKEPSRRSTRKPKTLSQKISRAWERFLDSLQIKSLTLRRSWFISHILFAILMGLTFVVRDTRTATILVSLIGIPWALTNWAPFALISSEISKRDAMRRGIMPPTDREAELVAAGEDDAAETGADQAGVVLGIHNVAIAAPQVIATLVSSVIFRILQKPRGQPGDNSVAWVLRFGGCCAIIAAYLTLLVHEEKESEEDVLARRRRPSNSSGVSY